MSVIYEPKGPAREYAPLACNLYRGCLNKCRYCYVPGILRMGRDDFHAQSIPRVKLDQFVRELEKLGLTDKREIQLCFTCDPYPVEGSELTRHIISTLAEQQHPVSILTKAGNRAMRDFEILAKVPKAQFGVSLVWADDKKRAEWEPGAAPVEERLNSLRIAKAMGIHTWASVEPVIDPEEALDAIELLMPVTDIIKVGRWNHSVEADKIDWCNFVAQAHSIMANECHPYKFKKGLAELL